VIVCDGKMEREGDERTAVMAALVKRLAVVRVTPTWRA
jgi:hypothetical protein